MNNWSVERLIQQFDAEGDAVDRIVDSLIYLDKLTLVSEYEQYIGRNNLTLRNGTVDDYNRTREYVLEFQDRKFSIITSELVRKELNWRNQVKREWVGATASHMREVKHG